MQDNCRTCAAFMLSFLLLVFMSHICACLFACVYLNMCAYSHICTWVWKPKIDARCHPSSLSTWSIEAVSLEEARTSGLDNLPSLLCRCPNYASQKLKLQPAALAACIFMCFQDVNSGSHSFIASNLFIEIFPMQHM